MANKNLVSKEPQVESFNLTGAIAGGLLSVLSGGTFGLIGIILWVLKTIVVILWYIFAKIVPFLVLYIGIPTFILGAIMGLFFLGGHLLFIIVFFVGIFIYIRKLLHVVYTLPVNNNNNNNNNKNNNHPHIKSKSIGY